MKVVGQAEEDTLEQVEAGQGRPDVTGQGHCQIVLNVGSMTVKEDGQPDIDRTRTWI
eukprot:m.3950 g.3950  ORF g.3950 m.3950 type:complete len:57 (+) comp10006_c0_seq1:1340-1510(+)